MTFIFKNKNIKVFIYFLAFALFLYSFIRAVNLSFIHDEALTFLYYVLAPIYNIVAYIGFSPSNNHLLNSILEKISFLFLGPSEFALRLPNLLAHLVFIIVSIKFVNKFFKPKFAVGAFILINFNPFMLDFFSLGRGYGLALMFLMLSVYFISLALFSSESKFYKNINLAFIFGGLAILSNSPFLIFYLALWIVFILFIFINRYFPAIKLIKDSTTRSIKSTFKRVGLSSTIFFVFILLSLLIVLKLKKMGEIYVGGKTGFFSDTIISLVRSSLYSNQPVSFEHIIIGAAILIFNFLILAFYLREFVKDGLNPKGHLSIGLFFVGIVNAIAVGTIMQHYIFGINYLTGRIALFFIPLFGLVVALFWQDIFDKKIIPRKIILSAFYLIALVFMVNFLISANFNKTLVWTYDADTKTAVNDLATYLKENKEQYLPLNRKLKIGVDWVFEPSVNYYIFKNKLYGYFDFVDRSGLFSKDFDFYFFSTNGKEGITITGNPNIEILKRYPKTSNILAKKVR